MDVAWVDTFSAVMSADRVATLFSSALAIDSAESVRASAGGGCDLSHVKT